MKRLLSALLLVFAFSYMGFAADVEIDYFEYADDASAQAAYVSSDLTTEVIEENFETGANDYQYFGDFGGTEYWNAAKFTISEDIFCPAASIYFDGQSGTPSGNVTLRIETDVGSEPSGTLAHANATATVSPSQPAWNKVSFTKFKLPAGTYWLVGYIPDQEEGQYWRWSVNSSGGGTQAYGEKGVSWTVRANFTFYYRIYTIPLQCYSEDAIKEQGSYSLKGVAAKTDSLNETLTRTVDPTVDLSGKDEWIYYIYSSRTGSNIKAGIHDSGGTTTESTPNVTPAGAWQKITVDISEVLDANKDDIDSIIITPVNADAANTFYFDWMYGYLEEPEVDHPTTSQLLLGGIWFVGEKKHSDWTRFKRGTTE